VLIIYSVNSNLASDFLYPIECLSPFRVVNSPIVRADQIIGTGPSVSVGPTGPTGLPGSITPVTGSWTLAPGANTVSFTVPAGNTYTMWVNGNIPNGIVVWNATVTVTNNNVPVIGQQFSWYYPSPGNALVLTSIPAQIIGTANTISNATPSVGNNTNVFEFGITNNSGESQIVNYGWTQIG
jgi:hypothetical protein